MAKTDRMGTYRGQSRPLADVRRRQPDLIGIGAKNMGLIGRSALGQDVDQLKIERSK